MRGKGVSLIRVAIIVSNIDKALAFEWIAGGIDSSRFQLSFILLNPGDSHLERYLRAAGIPVERVVYRGKGDLPAALWHTRRALRRSAPDIVHAHLFEGSLIGLSAARLAGVARRIYTRHHSDFHHRYHPKAVKLDRLVSALATDIVAPSDVVERILVDLDRVPAEKITVIHHGFELGAFSQVSSSRIDSLRAKYGLYNRGPVIGMASRFTELKGIQHVIPAFQRLLADEPNAVLVLANARGDYELAVSTLLSTLPSRSVVRIPFEMDNAALFKLFDIYVHTPIGPRSEAFGQTYVEALAAGIPSIFTLSGIASEFIVDEVNALVVPYADPGAVYASISRLLRTPQLRTQLSAAGVTTVRARFSLDGMLRGLERLYSDRPPKKKS